MRKSENLSDKWETLDTKNDSRPTSKSPIVNKKYTGNGSDSDEEDVKNRHKLEDKYRARGSHLNDDEKKIVNYIINK